jgi:hypothetical protein
VAARAAVGVEHRHNADDVAAAQQDRARVVLAEKEVERAVQHEARRRLARVDARREEDLILALEPRRPHAPHRLVIIVIKS